MNIFITIMFLLPLMLATFYLYVSDAFTNRRTFRVIFYSLWILFALTIIIVVQLPYQGYPSPATISASLSTVLLEPQEKLFNNPAELHP